MVAACFELDHYFSRINKSRSSTNCSKLLWLRKYELVDDCIEVSGRKDVLRMTRMCIPSCAAAFCPSYSIRCCCDTSFVLSPCLCIHGQVSGKLSMCCFVFEAAESLTEGFLLPVPVFVLWVDRFHFSPLFHLEKGLRSNEMEFCLLFLVYLLVTTLTDCENSN